MIDDFNALVERCQARQRKKIISFALKITAVLLLIIALFGVYLEFFIPKTKITSAIKKAPKVQEMNTTEPVVSIPIQQTPPPSPVVSLPKYNLDPTRTNVTPPAPSVQVPEKSPSVFNVTTPVKPASSMTPQELFDASPKFETALLNARNLYSKNNFSEAALWSKKANQMNREAEEAWLLYAKSYYAQGKKSEAIEVLQLYLNYKESKSANELLREWKAAQ